MCNIEPGMYRHYKGNLYEVLGFVKHSETGEIMVLYRALYGERMLWVRPALMWNETVEREGKTMRRFVRIDAPVLETKRLLLRPWEEDDAAELYRLASDPEIGPAAGWAPHTSVEDSLAVIRTVLGVPGTYAVVLRESGKPIGSCGVFPTRAQGASESELEIGYWIGRQYWGRGYAPEAVNALLAHCFSCGDSAVWCAYFDGNEKSRRVQQKCGFRPHHTESDILWEPTNERKTEHYTRITAEEFAALHPERSVDAHA